ncbi:MAG: phosphoribosylamine--glycine ligase [Anaerolineae bacterium]|nr:phosphoribosylamine--glycine ligase [Anaerolineae bacterium]
MHILVVGGGGREHALVWKLAQSPRVKRISVAPGNAGTAALAENVDIDATDVVSLLEYADSERIDLTVVGPEEPLAKGLVDQFEAVGLPIFGPHRQAAMIESSKSYAKHLMITNGVPTPSYEVFSQLWDALDYLSHHPAHELVIKADGLARGKGVFLPRGEADAHGILQSLLERDSLGPAGRQVLIEKRLSGEEVSIMAFTDGRTITMMPPVHDHKRLYDKGRGPNTGGMGAYTPAPILSAEMAKRVQQEIIKPVLHGLQTERCCFRGVLYVGVVLTSDGPKALELNTRLGDPGAQAVLPLLKTDLVDVIEACVMGNLNLLDIEWYNRVSVTVVMATEGYPERRDPGIPIVCAPTLPDGVHLFHAGTAINERGELVTTGGRVLNITAVAKDLPTAIRQAYTATRRVHFDGAHYRLDIGERALRWA